MDTTTNKAGTLESHRVLTFSGKDASSFLQGYLTCDTDQLTAHQALPGAFTNLKGRVVANGWVWGSSTEVQFLISASLGEKLGEFLKPYLNFSRTKLDIGASAPVVRLNEAQARVPGQIYISGHGMLDTTSTESLEDLSEPWIQQSIAAFEAIVTEPISDTYLPQMLGLTALGAVSFSKGCYLGQEVVARAEHRGEIKRVLKRASYHHHTLIEPGQNFTDSDNRRSASVICATPGKALLVTSKTNTGTQNWQHNDLPVELKLEDAPTP